MKFIVKFETEDGKYSQEFLYEVKNTSRTNYVNFHRNINKNSESVSNQFLEFQQGVFRNEER